MGDTLYFSGVSGLDFVSTDCPLLTCTFPILKNQQKIKEKLLELGWTG